MARTTDFVEATVPVPKFVNCSYVIGFHRRTRDSRSLNLTWNVRREAISFVRSFGMHRSNDHCLWQILLISSGFAVASGNIAAQGGNITIGNASFEQPKLGAGGSTGEMTDWNVLGAAGNQGIFVNDGTAGFGGIVKNVDGNQLSYVNGKGMNGYDQDTNMKLAAGMSYTLTAAVGLQTNSTLNGGNLFLQFVALPPVAGQPSVVAASTTIAFNDKNLMKGALTDFSVVLSDGKKFAGDELLVQVSSDGKATQGDFLVDNLRGSTAAAPEPISLAMATEGAVLVIGFFGLRTVSRRRKKSTFRRGSA
jgi:hypothetical protein